MALPFRIQFVSALSWFRNRSHIAPLNESSPPGPSDRAAPPQSAALDNTVEKKEKQRRAIRDEVHKERSVTYLARMGLCILITLSLIAVRDGLQIALNPLIAVSIIAATVILFSLLSALAMADHHKPIISQLRTLEKPVQWRDLVRHFETTINPLIAFELVYSAILIFAVSACVALFESDYVASGIQFAYAGLTFLVLEMSRRGRLHGSRIRRAVRFLLVVWLPLQLNAFAQEVPFDLGIAGGSVLRALFTALVAALILFIVFSEAQLLRQIIFENLLRLTPARRKVAYFPISLRNLIALKEYQIFVELQVIAVTSVAYGAIFYTLFRTVPYHWVFLIFNIFVTPAFLSVLIGIDGNSRAAQMFVRRLGMQYVIVALLVANILLLSGYVIGYGASYAYQYVFGELGLFPVPDILYELREVPISELPIIVQIESLAISALILLTVSWAVVVIQTRAWREAIYVTILAGAASTIPMLNINASGVLGNLFPTISEIPGPVLGLCVPAMKSLLGRDIDDLVAGSEPTRTCTECGLVSNQIEDNFCRVCGTKLNTEPTS